MIWVAIALTSHHYITHQYFGNFNATSAENSSNKIEKETVLTQHILEIKNGKEVVFKFANGIKITKNKEIVSAINSVPFLMDSLSLFFKNNYNKQLEIIGKYTTLENNANLGNLRANSLKNELISSGIKPTKIKTSGKNETFNFNENDVYYNGIELHFTPLNKRVLDSLENNITNKTLYLNYTNNKLIINNELVNYTNLVKQYLKNNPTKIIEITGHTNNKGYYKNNLIIGQNKANSVKAYLIKNGISENVITALSRGEAEPIANKYTDEGKALNNRIEIRIK